MDILCSSATMLALPAHSAPVQSLAFNNSGKLLATGDTKRVVRAWLNDVPFLDAKVEGSNFKLNGHERIRGIAFSPEGNRMYVLCGDTLRAYDLLSRAEIWSYQPPRSFGFLVTSPMTVAVSPAGNVLTVSDAGLVVVLDENGNLINKWWDNEAPRYAAFTNDGKGIVGADGFSVSLWEAYSGQKLGRLRSRERIYGMAVDSLRGVVATRTLHSVNLIDLPSLERTELLAAPAGLPLLAFSSDGRLLALGGKAEVLFLEVGSKRCFVLPVAGARVLSLAFHPGTSQVTAGCSDGLVRFWDVVPSAA